MRPMLSIDYGNLHAAAVGLPAIAALTIILVAALFARYWRR
jgi:hypothetical protein